MKNGLIIGGTVLGAILFVAVWTGYMFVSYQNSAVELETQFEAVEKKVKGTFDNMWKIISGKAGVSSEFKAGFLEVVNAQVKGREGGELMKFITESNPGFDTSLFRDVSNAIESQRTLFLNSQVELLDIKRQHDNLRKMFPGSLILSGRTALKYDVITSSRTEKAFETGRDDSNPDPFAANR